MCRKAISQSRHLIAQNRETRGCIQHVIETSQQLIRNSLRLIQRARPTCESTMAGSAGPEKPDINTDKQCEVARADQERLSARVRRNHRPR